MVNLRLPILQTRCISMFRGKTSFFPSELTQGISMGEGDLLLAFQRLGRVYQVI